VVSKGPTTSTRSRRLFSEICRDLLPPESLAAHVSKQPDNATSVADSKVALTIVTQSQSQLSLQQHLEIAPDILNCAAEDLDRELQPLMMAQAVPNPPNPQNEKKRVKVYELRNNDWYDRGTGFCHAELKLVCRLLPAIPTPEIYAACAMRCDGLCLLTLVALSRATLAAKRSRESSWNPRRFQGACFCRPRSARRMASRSSKVCHVGSWSKTSSLRCFPDTLIVWTEPSTQVEMALSFQEAEGCATIWCVPAPVCVRLVEAHKYLLTHIALPGSS